MPQHISEVEFPKVGETYLVPCIELLPQSDGRFVPYAKRLSVDHPYKAGQFVTPVILPGHHDPELNNPNLHYHLDLRFVLDSMGSYNPGFAIWTDSPDSQRTEFRAGGFSKAPVDLPLHCTMSKIHPFNRLNDPHQSLEVFFQGMERTMACKRLKPGMICPHKGFSLKGYDQGDGTAICPGHGLHWDLKTGELIPRHTKPMLGAPIFGNVAERSKAAGC